MAVISMKQLLEAGCALCHQTRRWNPIWRGNTSLQNVTVEAAPRKRVP